MDPSVEASGEALRVSNEQKEARTSEEGGATTSRSTFLRAAKLHRWAFRVSAYLCQCVDGGLLGEAKFGLADVAEAIGLVGPEADKVGLLGKRFMNWSREAKRAPKASARKRVRVVSRLWTPWFRSCAEWFRFFFISDTKTGGRPSRWTVCGVCACG